MADPKYAYLPGIAHDQPDVYETNDLPEADRHIEESLPEENSDSVETLHISSYEAMGKFRGKYVESGRVDFSDRIHDVGRKGYVVFTRHGDEEEVEESPIQKYQRLNAEVRELIDDIEKIKEIEEKKSSSSESVTGLALQVEGLRSQLSSLQLEQVLGSSMIKSLEDPRGTADRDKIINDIKRVVSLDNKAPTSGGDGVTYEFYLKPELAKLQQQAEVGELEKRIQVLERVLGASQEKMSSLSIETNQKTVLNAIYVLSSRTYLLEPSHLDHVEGRLGALQQKLKEISERSAAVENAEKMNKISELYDMVQRNEAVSAALPEVVDRLEALEALHNRALQFNKALSQLDAVQEKLVASLSNNQKLLEDTKNKIFENTNVIQSNFASVEKRLGNLEK